MTTYTYNHSESFAILKSTDETIKVNLTSYQYLSVLDDLLYKAIYPIIEGTRFVDTFLSQMLGWQTLNPKRKTSGLGRQAFSSNTTLYLLSDSPIQKLKIIKKMRLDRSILFEILRRWFSMSDELDIVGKKIATPETIKAMHDLQSKCSVKPGYGFTSLFRVSKYWYSEALEFKKQILEKYVRLCLMTAKRDYEELQHKVPLNDIVQVYLLTATKAIDKCDSEKGVLTPYIQNWFLSAKNVVVSTYLIGAGQDHSSVQVSTTTNKKIVDGLTESSLTDDTLELSHSDDEDRENREFLEETRRVAKVFDPVGYARLLLGVTEKLSKEDSQLLRSLAVTTAGSSDRSSTPVNNKV